MAYCLPLTFCYVGPGVAICATRIVALMSTNSYQARQTIKAEKRNGTLVNACGRAKAKTAVFLDNGTVIASPLTVQRVITAIDKANEKSMNPKTRKSTKIRLEYDPIDETIEEAMDEEEDTIDDLDEIVDEASSQLDLDQENKEDTQSLPFDDQDEVQEQIFDEEESQEDND